MYDSKYLAEQFGVSLTTIRKALRDAGYGVGNNGAYRFDSDVIDDVLEDLATVLNRPVPPKVAAFPPNNYSFSVTGGIPSPPAAASRGQRVGQVLLDNKRSIILLILALLSAVLGVDLAV